MHKYLEKKNEVNFDKIFHQTLGESRNEIPVVKPDAFQLSCYAGGVWIVL